MEVKEVFVNTQEIRVIKTRSTKPKCVLERNGPILVFPWTLKTQQFNRYSLELNSGLDWIVCMY